MTAAHNFDRKSAAPPGMPREAGEPGTHSGPRLFDLDPTLTMNESTTPRENGWTPPPCLIRLAEHLKQSKLVQWLITYLAAAWLTLQLLETLSDIWGWSDSLQRGTSVALGLLFLPAAVVAWYHGEQGRQRVCLSEISIVGGLVALTGAVVWSLCAG